MLFHAVGQGEDGPAALGLPVVIDDGFAQAFADPLRGGLVQRLTGQKQRTQAGQVVLAQERRVLLFEHAHGSGRAEHHGDAVLLHQLPPDAAMGPRGQALVQDGRHAADQRAVDDVAMPHHPADVAGAEIGLAGLGAKNMLHAGGQRHGVTAAVALHALGLAGGAAGVQRVTGVGGFQPDAGNHRGGALFAQSAPEMVPPGNDIHGGELAVCQQDRLRFVAGQRDGGVEQRLVGHDFAAARTGVGADDQRGLRIFDARGQRARGETAKHHRVDGSNAGTGQHGEHGVGNHGHVNQHPVAGAHTQQLHGGGHALNFVVQLGVGVDALGVGFGGNGDQGGLVAPGSQVPVDGVVADVGRAADEPLGKGWVAVVANLLRLRLPINFLSLFGPKGVGLGERAAVKFLVAGHGLSPRGALHH